MSHGPSPSKRPKLDISANLSDSFLTAKECCKGLGVVSYYQQGDLDAVWQGEAFGCTQFIHEDPSGKKNFDDLQVEQRVYDMFKTHFELNQQGAFLVHSAASPCVTNPGNWNEIDLLIITRSHGVIRVEVKSGPNVSDGIICTGSFEEKPQEYRCPRELYCRGVHQLSEQRKRLQFLLQAADTHNSERTFAKPDKAQLENLVEKLPMAEIIALPKCKEAYLKTCKSGKEVCNCERRHFAAKYKGNEQNCLFGEQLSDANSFSNWWNKRMERFPRQDLSLETYRFLVCWLVLAPFVVSPKKRMITVGASKYRIHNKMFQSIADCFTPQQTDLAASTGTVWVRGAAGTGKTLILQFVAKDIAQKIVDNKLPDKVLILTVNRPLAAALTYAFQHDIELRPRGSTTKANVFSYIDRERMHETVRKAKADGGRYEQKRKNGAFALYKQTRQNAHIWCFPIKAFLGMIYYESKKESFKNLNTAQQANYMQELCTGLKLRSLKGRTLPTVGFRHIFWDETQNVEGPFCDFATWLQDGVEPTDGHKLDRHLFLFNDPPYQEAQFRHGKSVEKLMEEMTCKDKNAKTKYLTKVFRQTRNMHKFSDNYRELMPKPDGPEMKTVFPLTTKQDGAWPEGPVTQFHQIEARNKGAHGGLLNSRRAALEVMDVIREILDTYKHDPWLKKKSVNPTRAEHRVKQLLASEICVLTVNEDTARQLRRALNVLLKDNPFKQTHNVQITEAVSAEEATSRQNCTVVVDSWRRMSGLDSVCVIVYDPPIEKLLPNPVCDERQCQTQHKQQVELMYYCAFSRPTTLLYILGTQSTIDGFNCPQSQHLPYKYLPAHRFDG